MEKIFDERNYIAFFILIIGIISLSIYRSDIFTTKVKTYKIYTAEEFMNIENNMFGNYEIMNDIDFSDTEFHMLGSYYNPFSGEINGNGYSLKNITVNEVENSRNDAYYGIFGKLSDYGEINNLGIENLKFNIDYTGTGRLFIGGLVGYGDYNGFMSNIYFNGEITGESTGLGDVYIGAIAGQSHCYIGDLVVVMDVDYQVNSGELWVSGASRENWSGIDGYVVDANVKLKTSENKRGYVNIGAHKNEDKKLLTSFKITYRGLDEDTEDRFGNLLISDIGDFVIDSSIIKNGILEKKTDNISYQEINDKDFYVNELGMDENIWNFSKLDAENRVYPKLKKLK